MKMNSEIEKLRQQQKEELARLRAKQKEKLAQLRAKEKKHKSKELSEKRRTLARLDHIMGALVRKRIKPEQYIAFMQNSADPRDRDFATERYSIWHQSDESQTRESYDFVKSAMGPVNTSSQNQGGNAPRLL